MQLDMLSSALPSAMAPNSGLSYEAENPPSAPGALQNVDVNVLFQQLMENGVFDLFTQKNEEKLEKKVEEKKVEEKKEIVSLSNPDTIKMYAFCLSLLINYNISFSYVKLILHFARQETS